VSLLFNTIARKYDFIVTAMGLSNEKKMVRLIKDCDIEIADIGGGTGTLALMLAAKKARVTIIDPCIPMTNIAKQKNPRVKVINAYAEQIPVQNETFDLVCMRDSLHHMAGQEAVLNETVRILKPKGTIIIQEFNPESAIGKGLCVLERLLGEKTKLVSAERLVKILKGLSVQGRLHWISRYEYIFEGCKLE